MTVCALPSCQQPFSKRPGQRYCSRRCAGAVNGQKGNSTPRSVLRSVLRERIVDLLTGREMTERNLAQTLYGADDPATIRALRMVLARGGPFFRSQGVHIEFEFERTYRLVPGYRLKEVAL